MTKAEKSEIFNLLTTAEGWISEYRSEVPMPEFTDSEDFPVIPDNFTSIESISDAINACTVCKLCKTRKKPVTGEGPAEIAKVTVLVIGEVPDDEENESGKPFSGKNGQLLDKDAFIHRSFQGPKTVTRRISSNASPHRFQKPYRKKSIFVPFFSYLVCPNLGHQTSIHSCSWPKLPCEVLLGTSEDLARIHGRFFDYRGIPLLATFHPCDLLRDETLKRPAWEDLKSFKERIVKCLNGLR